MRPGRASGSTPPGSTTCGTPETARRPRSTCTRRRCGAWATTPTGRTAGWRVARRPTSRSSAPRCDGLRPPAAHPVSSRNMRIRAALLPETGAGLELAELELAPPGPREALVRLHASGVCHSDQNAIDGTAATRCPAVLGHEGSGIVEEVGPGTTLVAPGDRVALS